MTAPFLLTAAAIVAAATAGASPAMTWGYSPPSTSTGGDGRLAYGVDGTDDVLAILDCRAGSRMMRISSWVDERPKSRWVTISSGRVRSRRLSKIEPNDLAEGFHVETAAPVNDPVLLAFRRGGPLRVETHGAHTDLPPAPEVLRRSAFADCGLRR